MGKDGPATISFQGPETAEVDLPPTIQASDDEGASDIILRRKFFPVDTVWVKYGRMWYPAKFVSNCDAPAKLQKKPIQK